MSRRETEKRVRRAINKKYTSIIYKLDPGPVIDHLRESGVLTVAGHDTYIEELKNKIDRGKTKATVNERLLDILFTRENWWIPFIKALRQCGADDTAKIIEDVLPEKEKKKLERTYHSLTRRRSSESVDLRLSRSRAAPVGTAPGSPQLVQYQHDWQQARPGYSNPHVNGVYDDASQVPNGHTPAPRSAEEVESSSFDQDEHLSAALAILMTVFFCQIMNEVPESVHRNQHVENPGPQQEVSSDAGGAVSPLTLVPTAQPVHTGFNSVYRHPTPAINYARFNQGFTVRIQLFLWSPVHGGVVPHPGLDNPRFNISGVGHTVPQVGPNAQEETSLKTVRFTGGPSQTSNKAMVWQYPQEASGSRASHHCSGYNYTESLQQDPNQTSSDSFSVSTLGSCVLQRPLLQPSPHDTQASRPHEDDGDVNDEHQGEEKDEETCLKQVYETMVKQVHDGNMDSIEGKITEEGDCINQDAPSDQGYAERTQPGLNWSLLYVLFADAESQPAQAHPQDLIQTSNGSFYLPESVLGNSMVQEPSAADYRNVPFPAHIMPMSMPSVPPPCHDELAQIALQQSMRQSANTVYQLRVFIDI